MCLGSCEFSVLPWSPAGEAPCMMIYDVRAAKLLAHVFLRVRHTTASFTGEEPWDNLVSASP
eukprot:9446079-Pyramimonas_sp.AAC.1